MSVTRICSLRTEALMSSLQQDKNTSRVIFDVVEFKIRLYCTHHLLNNALDTNSELMYDSILEFLDRENLLYA